MLHNKKTDIQQQRLTADNITQKQYDGEQKQIQHNTNTSK
jgi:hypothetical protein|tara:strand:- start:461 stop:580 length:120 start_codon:yes stop_codon:yes gene_type:complete